MQTLRERAAQCRLRATEFEGKAETAIDPREAAYWTDLARIEAGRADKYEAAN